MGKVPSSFVLRGAQNPLLQGKKENKNQRLSDFRTLTEVKT